MESLRLPDPRLCVDGRRLGCKSWLAYAGAYQLTLSTTVPDLAAELHSSYLGHPDGQTAIAHLRLQPGDAPAIVSDRQPGGQLLVREARRLCLYDHLQVLRELIADYTGATVSVNIADTAVELVDIA